MAKSKKETQKESVKKDSPEKPKKIWTNDLSSLETVEKRKARFVTQGGKSVDRSLWYGIKKTK